MTTCAGTSARTKEPLPRPVHRRLQALRHFCSRPSTSPGKEEATKTSKIASLHGEELLSPSSLSWQRLEKVEDHWKTHCSPCSWRSATSFVWSSGWRLLLQAKPGAQSLQCYNTVKSLGTAGQSRCFTSMVVVNASGAPNAKESSSTACQCMTLAAAVTAFTLRLRLHGRSREGQAHALLGGHPPLKAGLRLSL